MRYVFCKNCGGQVYEGEEIYKNCIYDKFCSVECAKEDAIRRAEIKEIEFEDIDEQYIFEEAEK